MESKFNVLRDFRLPAVLCMLVVLACFVLVRPHLESGMDDDWAYMVVARSFARTGRLIYNGWESPILACQVAVAGILIKLFGFSFFISRISTLLVGMASAFFLHRSMTRSGLNAWNATIATLFAILSFNFVSLTASFMTDIWGLFPIVLCFYACLRSLQTNRTGASMFWIGFAALSSALGGADRQTAWLGVLVMVPCALWLLRTRKQVLLFGIAACLCSVAFIVLCMKWFAKQPYALTEPRLFSQPFLHTVEHCFIWIVIIFLSLIYHLIPVLAMFALVPMKRDRYGNRAIVAAASFSGIFSFALYQLQHHRVHLWISPDLSGEPRLLQVLLILFLAAIETFGVIGLILAAHHASKRSSHTAEAADSLPWSSLALLLLPFLLAYLCLLFPRASEDTVYPRYMLVLLAFTVLPVVKLYQQQLLTRLPILSLLAVLAVGAYNVAQVHDNFATYRARMSAVRELRASGVPDTAIDNGMEFNGLTEIAQRGYINHPWIRVPSGAYKRGPLTPDVHPLYAIAFDTNSALDSSRFARVPYRTWLAPRSRFIYVQHVTAPGKDGRK